MWVYVSVSSAFISITFLINVFVLQYDRIAYITLNLNLEKLIWNMILPTGHIVSYIYFCMVSDNNLDYVRDSWVGYHMVHKIKLF